MKNKKILIAVIALVALVAIMVSVYLIARPKTEEGVKNITVTVVHKDGSEKVFTCKTTEEYLGPVLVQNKIVEDNRDSYGLYILVADGELADYNVDQGWWAIYDGETQSNYGADETPIRDGGSYKLVYTVGF